MGVDFKDAAYRHYGDAECLFEKDRMPNTDHLSGMAAECALKAIMAGLGMCLGADRNPVEAEHRVHIDRLWDEFVTFAQGRVGARYSYLFQSGPNPFAAWHVSQRYYHESFFTQDMVEQHKDAAFQIMIILQKAEADQIVS